MMCRLFILWILISSVSMAQDREYYSDIPSFDDIKAKEYTDLDSEWPQFKEGMVHLLAMIYGLYDGYNVYFLARDSEYLHFATEGLPIPSGVISNLINVSRKNMNDELLLEYLEQRGLSAKSLQSGSMTGRHSVMLDTGKAGTIPDQVATLFTLEENSSLKSQFIVSTNENIPSARTFLAAVAPSKVADLSPRRLHAHIRSYEHLPHYTYRSTGFELVEDELIPFSNEKKDAKRNRKGAKKYYADLKFYVAQPEIQELFEERLAMWRSISRKVLGGDQRGLKRFFTKIIAQSYSDPQQLAYAQAMILDTLDIIEKDNIPVGHGINLKELKKTRLNLKLIDHKSPFSERLNQDLRKAKNVTKLSSFSNASLVRGQVIQTPKGQIYLIENDLGATDGIQSFNIRDNSGNHGVLSFADHSGSKTRKRIKDTGAALSSFRRAGVKSQKQWEIESDYIVYDYLEGTNLSRYLQYWQQNPHSYSEQRDKFKRLIARLIRKGILIENLAYDHFVFIGSYWYVVQGANIRKRSRASSVKRGYQEKFESLIASSNTWSIRQSMTNLCNEMFTSSSSDEL